MYEIVPSLQKMICKQSKQGVTYSFMQEELMSSLQKPIQQLMEYLHSQGFLLLCHGFYNKALHTLVQCLISHAHVLGYHIVEPT